MSEARSILDLARAHQASVAIGLPASGVLDRYARPSQSRPLRQRGLSVHKHQVGARREMIRKLGIRGVEIDNHGNALVSSEAGGKQLERALGLVNGRREGLDD